MPTAKEKNTYDVGSIVFSAPYMDEMKHSVRFEPPKRSLGQNFLHDPNTARKIVAAAELNPSDSVLEIGPGQGALSSYILKAGPRLYAALEKDDNLAYELKRKHPSAVVIHCDALEFAWERLQEQHWTLVGNLPYNIASPLVWEIVSRTPGMKRSVFMVQKEVGLRMAAGPGKKAYGALSVWIQNYCYVKAAFTVSPNVFRPRPKVDSQVVVFTPKKRQIDFNPSALGGLIRICFQKRRKQLGSILKEIVSPELKKEMAKQGVELGYRPEVLSPEKFAMLSNLLKDHFPA